MGYDGPMGDKGKYGKRFLEFGTSAAGVALCFGCCLWGLGILLTCFRHGGVDAFPLPLKGGAAFLGMAASCAVLMAGRRIPRVTAGLWWTQLAALAGAVGFAGIGVGLHAGSDGSLLLGFALCSLGLLWAFALTAMAASRLSVRQRTAALAAGFLVQCIGSAASAVLGARGSGAAAFAAALLLPVATAFAFRAAAPVLQLMESASSARTMEAEHPASFLPFSNKLFTMIAILACLASFASMQMEAMGGSAVDGVVSKGVALAAVGLVFVRARGDVFIDRLFYAAICLTIVGFIVGVLWDGGGACVERLGSVCLAGAAEMLVLFIYLLVFALSARNAFATVPLVAFASMAFTMGLVVDFFLWQLATVLPGTTVAMLFFLGFVIYTLLFLRGYSFEGAIRDVEPLREEAAEVPDRSMRARCEAVADAYHLTARERDIFMLLARGRDYHFIERELVVSRNTVKTHTRNIYGKLGVHSRQELIDLVEK